MAIHAISVKTCVAGLIPIKTTLTGADIKVALEVLIQGHAWMLIRTLTVSFTVFRFLKLRMKYEMKYQTLA